MSSERQADRQAVGALLQLLAQLLAQSVTQHALAASAAGQKSIYTTNQRLSDGLTAGLLERLRRAAA